MNRFRADLVLLVVALIWGSAFAVQRVAAGYFDVFMFNGLRFLLGGLVLLPFSKFNPLKKSIPADHGGIRGKSNSLPERRLNRRSIVFIVLAGGFLFGAAGLQQAGLATTTAGNARFITTLYVVLVPVILTVFWKENIHLLSWLAAAIAILGSLLLSTRGTLHLSSGDSLEMAGALLWALHVILVSRAVKTMPVLTFSVGQYLAAGLFNIVAAFGMKQSLAGLAVGWWTIVYIGLISTAIGYTLQVLGQKYAPPTDATILLSMEAVFAAVTGFIFLQETMEVIQLVGCGLILAAVLVTQLKSVRVSSANIELMED
jgi:drug/metabolite transporter (DMT)-like permease